MLRWTCTALRILRMNADARFGGVWRPRTCITCRCVHFDDELIRKAARSVHSLQLEYPARVRLVVRSLEDERRLDSRVVLLWTLLRRQRHKPMRDIMHTCVQDRV